MIVRRSFVVIAVALLSLVACSDDDGSGGGATGPASPTSEPAPSETPSAAEAPSEGETAGDGGTEIQSEDAALGVILTDGAGRTLYVFLNDEQGGPSTCSGDCAASWPPLLANGEVEVGGDGDDPTDASLVGTIARDDGGAQVTYDGWPLYYFGGDEGPGDTNGQGVGDVWFVVSPAGEPIQA
jgi:predicted lipoprotein with Yx(FWY)xxD motif